MGQAGGQRDALQVGAAIERQAADPGHALADLHAADQAVAGKEFVVDAALAGDLQQALGIQRVCHALAAAAVVQDPEAQRGQQAAVAVFHLHFIYPLVPAAVVIGILEADAIPEHLIVDMGHASSDHDLVQGCAPGKRLAHLNIVFHGIHHVGKVRALQAVAPR